MKLVVGVIGTVGLGSIIIVFLILARLTQKWEVVTKVKSYYHLFYVATALVGLALLVRLVRIERLSSGGGPSILDDPRSWVYVCFYHVPLVIGTTISLLATWRNWGWLLRERD